MMDVHLTYLFKNKDRIHQGFQTPGKHFDLFSPTVFDPAITSEKDTLRSSL